MVVQKALTFFLNLRFIKRQLYQMPEQRIPLFLTPHYNIDYNGWHIDGTIMEWDYSILDQRLFDCTG